MMNWLIMKSFYSVGKGEVSFCLLLILIFMIVRKTQTEFKYHMLDFSDLVAYREVVKVYMIRGTKSVIPCPFDK